MAAFEQQQATDQDGKAAWLRRIAKADTKTTPTQAQNLLATAGARA